MYLPKRTGFSPMMSRCSPTKQRRKQRKHGRNSGSNTCNSSGSYSLSSGSMRQKKHQKKQEEELAEVTKEFMYYPCSGVLGAKVENHHSRLVQNTYTNFVWLLAYPDVLSFVSPYLTCQFAATWKPLARPTSTYKYQKFTYGDTVDGRIDEITESILHSYASPISTCQDATRPWRGAPRGERPS